MKCVNVIIILNPGKDKILFCKRMNDPYKGMFNFVGGKVEDGETSNEAAYRELYEETGIGHGDVHLYYFMDYVWHLQNLRMEVYAGVLKHEVRLRPEKNPLHWLDFTENFFNMNRFAGEGNLGHMLEILKMSKEIFGPIPLELEELKSQGCLYIERIEEGFDHYQRQDLKASPEVLLAFLRHRIYENGWENSYVDFYYGRLNETEKQKVHTILTSKQIKYLDNLHIKTEQIYFRLTEDLFQIAFQLTITEMLFSTFYFSKNPMTIWGNYDNNFVVFMPIEGS